MIFLERKFTTKVQMTSPGGSLRAFRRACNVQGFSRSLTSYFIYGAAFRRSFNERRLPARLSRTHPRRRHSTEHLSTEQCEIYRSSVIPVQTVGLWTSALVLQVLKTSDFSPVIVFFRLFRKSEIVLPNEYAHGLAQRSYINALFMDVFLTGVWIYWIFFVS